MNPEESTKEAPYIKRNIKATRAAMNINVNVKNVKDFAVRRHEPQRPGPRRQLGDHPERAASGTPSVLQLTYQRLQEIRTFYEFNDVDIDRYDLDDRKTQVADLGAASSTPTGVTSSSWVNRHLAVHPRVRRRPLAGQRGRPPRAIRS